MAIYSKKSQKLSLAGESSPDLYSLWLPQSWELAVAFWVGFGLEIDKNIGLNSGLIYVLAYFFSLLGAIKTYR